MNNELYLKILKLNKQMLLDTKKINEIIILKNQDSFVISNLNKIDLESFHDNMTLTIDGNLFDIFNNEKIKKDEETIHSFKNIYLMEGNKIVEKLFENIKPILDKYQIDTTKLYVINYNPNINYFINDLFHLITAYSIKDLKMRYSYVYDLVSYELDRRFNDYNLCDFQDSICVRKRELINKMDKEKLCYGCCYTKGRLCPYFKNKKCTIKSLSCKFFICNYLKKRGINYKPSDFLLIKKFFKQFNIFIMSDFLYTPKEEVLNAIK